MKTAENTIKVDSQKLQELKKHLGACDFANVCKALEFPHITDRLVYLNDRGYHIAVRSMGSGGVGQIKKMKNGEYRVQISYGLGRWNYAYVVLFQSTK